MVKKRSASRGFMTEEEVSEHLKTLSSDDGKIAYLKEIDSQQGLLAPQTERNVRKVLAGVYEKRGDLPSAGDILLGLGGEDRNKAMKLLLGSQDVRAAQVLENHDALKEAASVYSNVYHHLDRFKEDVYKQQARAALGKAIELYAESDDSQTAGWLTINTSAGLYSSNNSEKLKYAAILERVADKESDLSYKIKFLDAARERYERAGKGVKASTIGKKLSPLEAKLESEKARRGYAAIGISGVGLLGGAFFSSTKLTGNVIGMSTQTSSIIGVVLLIIGIIAGFFWLRNKRKDKKVVVSVPVKKKSSSKKK